MTGLKDYFLANARLSRSAVARYLGERRSTVDETADDLDLPSRLTLDDVQEVILAMDECTDSEASDDENEEDEEE
jgi:hypothetical protein